MGAKAIGSGVSLNIWGCLGKQFFKVSTQCNGFHLWHSHTHTSLYKALSLAKQPVR